MDLKREDTDALFAGSRPHIIAFGLATFIAAIVVFYCFIEDKESPEQYDLPTPPQCKSGWQGEELDEPSIKARGSTTVQCYSPATGQALGIVNPATPDGIDRAVTRAKEAQLAWAKTSFGQRRKVLRTLLKYVLDQQDEIAAAACLDSGKTKVDALFGEILVTAEKLKWTIKHGEKALRPSARPTNLLMFYKSNTVRYEPLGVVAACVSWNYPFHNLLGPIISSLFTGNAIIVKNSEQTAWSSAYFLAIVRGALIKCGHSPNLVHAITCWPDTANHLTSHPDVSHLTFIGSRPVAHAVAASAAKALIPCVIELGGKDPAIILDHPSGSAPSKSELNRISSILMRGVFQSAGQNCIGIERIIAQPASYTALLSLLTPRIKALRLGNGLLDSTADVGAMISSASFTRLESLITSAVAQGATLICGGKRHIHPSHPKGHYFQPTLLADVTPSMAIAQTELFAPIALLFRADSVDDCIAIANSTSYALGASVFGPTTPWPSQANANLDKVVREVKSGMVAVNDFAAYYAVQLPFGGVGGSGYGRFAGEEGLRGPCNAKSVCQDRWGRGLFIRTKIPGLLDYPVTERSWTVGKGVVQIGYGEGVEGRLGGVAKILGL